MIAVVQYQGHLQTGQSQSGMEDLHFNVTRKFANEHVTVVHPRRWNSDVPALMDMLTRQEIHRVILIGYSWGAGYTCMKFAKLAPEWGIKIPLALLCDPVYRPTWMPGWLPANPLNIYSLDRRTKIHVPQTIKRVAWVRQKLSIPNGHELVSEYGHTHIVPGRVINGHTHMTIDEAPEWFSLVRNELEFELDPGP
jgi:pimeloyl-ACP methyl ester carboxylesterase